MRTKRKIDDCRECIYWLKGPLTKLPRNTWVYDDVKCDSFKRSGILAGGHCSEPTQSGEHGYIFTDNDANSAIIRVNDRTCKYFDPGSAHEKAARLAEKLNPTT